MSDEALAADYDWCRRQLSHYENFQVVSWFVPRTLRRHFWAVYAFCRTVDDLGDEAAGNRLLALDEFAAAFRASLDGSASTPLFRALAHTIHVRQLPEQPFWDLIEANRQDQRVQRYATFDDVLDYCRLSANPVGRLVLALFDVRDPNLLPLSDAVCTALQLTNFWQDLQDDWGRGRCYVPLADLAAEGLDPEGLANAPESPPAARVLARERERAWSLFRQGAALEARVPTRLRLQLRLYRLGGEAVLSRLDRSPAVRPHLNIWGRLAVAWKVLGGSLL